MRTFLRTKLTVVICIILAGTWFAIRTTCTHFSEKWYKAAIVASRTINQDPQIILCAFDKALFFDPRNAKASCLKADTELNLNRPKESLNTTERALKYDSSRADLWLRKANALRALDSPLGALEAYKHLVLHAPNDSTAYHVLADLYRNTARHKAAIRTYETMHERWPQDTAAWFRHADILLDMGRRDKAYQVLNQLIDVMPTNFEARLRRFEYLCFFGKPSDPKFELDELLRIDSTAGTRARVILALASAYERFGNWEAAVAKETRIIALNPDDGSAWLRRAQAKADAGYPFPSQLDDLDSSIAQTWHEVEGVAGAPYQWCAKAGVYAKMGQLKRALSILDSINILLPDLPEAWQQKSEIQFDAHQYEAALNSIDNAIRLKAKDPWSHRMRARILTAMNKLGTAVQ